MNRTNVFRLRRTVVVIIVATTISCIHLLSTLSINKPVDQSPLSINNIVKDNIQRHKEMTVVKVHKKKTVKHIVIKTIKPRHHKLVASRELNTTAIKEYLAKLLYTEGRGESLMGQIAIINTIFNRYYSGRYHGSIYKIAYAAYDGVREPGFNNVTPTDMNYAAVNKALQGYRVFGSDVVYYYNPHTATDTRFINSVKPVMQIGHHIFAIDKNK